MRNRRRNRAGRILVAALIVFLAVTAAQAAATAQTGTLAGLLLVAGFGIACFRAGRRRQAQAPATGARRPQAQAARLSARRGHSLGARITRDAARLLISRR